MAHEPRVGTGVIVWKDGKILLGKRKGPHAGGEWAFPGGHLEFYESVEECAIRETREEAGIRVKNVRKGPYTEDLFPESNKHYITLFLLAEHDIGEPQVMEPESCSEWGWFSWDDLPTPLMEGVAQLVEKGFDPTKHF